MLISADCFHDEELRLEVLSNAETTGICAVCHQFGQLVDSNTFAGFYDAILSMFSPAPTGRTVVDIIQEEWQLFKDKEIAKALLSEVFSSSDYGYMIDSFVGYNEEIKDRVSIWERLKTNVMETSRFFTSVDEFERYGYLTPGYNLNEGTKLYRARIIPVGQSKLRRKDMGCPPKEFATAGRANPIGISYLYLSDSPKTTYYEVRAVYLDKLSVATFKLQRPQNLVDFIYELNLFLSYNDGTLPLQEYVIKKKVIEAISLDLSKPLRRYDSELEYVPTQFICEYCKNYVHGDGVSFESSLHKGGHNFVLFDPSAAVCKKVETHEISRIDIDRL